MILDFIKQQKLIKENIIENFPKILEEINVENFGEFTTDFLDFDKHTKSKTFFFDFSNYTFDSFSNESNVQNIEVHFYMAFRNKTSELLNEEMLLYTSAFYEFFERNNSSFSGAVDFAKIEEISFFQAVEGNTNVKLTDIKVNIQTEI